MYEAGTAQNVFLRTIYQGLSEKHENIRREFETTSLRSYSY